MWQRILVVFSFYSRMCSGHALQTTTKQTLFSSFGGKSQDVKKQQKYQQKKLEHKRVCIMDAYSFLVSALILSLFGSVSHKLTWTSCSYSKCSVYTAVSVCVWVRHLYFFTQQDASEILGGTKLSTSFYSFCPVIPPSVLLCCCCITITNSNLLSAATAIDMF